MQHQYKGTLCSSSVDRPVGRGNLSPLGGISRLDSLWRKSSFSLPELALILFQRQFSFPLLLLRWLAKKKEQEEGSSPTNHIQCPESAVSKKSSPFLSPSKWRKKWRGGFRLLGMLAELCV